MPNSKFSHKLLLLYGLPVKNLNWNAIKLIILSYKCNSFLSKLSHAYDTVSSLVYCNSNGPVVINVVKEKGVYYLHSDNTSHLKLDVKSR